jgi:hypothetical protein
MDKMRTTGGCLNNPANLKFCTFNMDNETVKWTGHTNDAPLAVKYGFIQYAYDTIKTMNYGLRNMIGTISEGYARKKYIARIEQGGSQFTEIVKDLMI